MKTLSRFVTKFTNLIVAVLFCFDRVIFKGYLPITNGPALEGFVDHILKIRRCDFMDFAEEQSECLVDHASAWPKRPSHTENGIQTNRPSRKRYRLPGLLRVRAAPGQRDSACLHAGEQSRRRRLETHQSRLTGELRPFEVAQELRRH